MIARPEKIVCVGLNYRDHAEEQGVALPERPLLFAKWPNTLIGDGEAIRIPTISQNVDYEAELGVVIGRRASGVTVDDALTFVDGYVVANDVSGRDLQFADGQWVRGKSLDTFLPVGELVPASEVPDPQSLAIRAVLNGVVDAGLQHLEPDLRRRRGDRVRLTGDHARAGRPDHHRHARGRRRVSEPACLAAPGDEITIEIDGVGSITNPVTPADCQYIPKGRANMSFVLVVRMKAKEGKDNARGEVAASSRPRRGPSRAVRRTFPAATRRTRAPSSSMSNTRDRAAFEAHGASEHFQRLAVGGLFELMESRERTFFETV